MTHTSKLPKEIRPAKINAIFALDRNGGIGLGNVMPWPKIKDDMRRFKRLTEKEVVIMGRSTWDAEDMIKPLPGRVNVIVTNRPLPEANNKAPSDWQSPIISASGSLDVIIDLIQIQQPYRSIWVIGGASVLYQAAPLIEQIYLTRLFDDWRCDTFVDLERMMGVGKKDFELVETIFADGFYDEYCWETWKRK